MNTFFYILTLLAALIVQTSTFAHKPYNELQVKNINLSHYPHKIEPQLPGVEITIGDLHGNALKLINFLIRNDVMTISRSDYLLLSTIYNIHPEQLTTKDLALFQIIINSSGYKREHKIRFLGDDLCDRGMNDYYTLFLFKKLDEAQVPFEIVLSNHGNFFLSAFERPEKSFSYNPYGEGVNEPVVQSMLHLGTLVNRGLVDKEVLIELIQTHYLKHLVLPGYILNKKRNEITLYTHAPSDLNILSSLASDLKLPFNDADADKLTLSFDKINQQVHQWIMTNTFTQHYNELNDMHKKAGTPSPLKQILWNRDYTILSRDHRPIDKYYSINYVHGHNSMHNVFDLDNKLGKGAHRSKGPYAIYLTHP